MNEQLCASGCFDFWHSSKYAPIILRHLGLFTSLEVPEFTEVRVE